MATTYTLISSNVLSSSAASVTFSSIPSTYTDLVLRVSARGDVASTTLTCNLTVNGLTSNYSRTNIYGNGSSTGSFQNSTAANTTLTNFADGASATANTFSNGEIYIPSYTVVQNKPIAAFSGQEDNNASAFLVATAGLSTNTAAITSVTLTPSSGNFASGSSFYLYGIKNS